MVSRTIVQAYLVNLRELPALPQGRWFTCALGGGSDADGLSPPDSRERFGRQFHRLEVPRLENATGETLGAGIRNHGAPPHLLFALDGTCSCDFQCFPGMFHAFLVTTIFIPLLIACRSRMSDF